MGVLSVPSATANGRPSKSRLRTPMALALLALTVFYLQFSYLPQRVFEAPASVVQLSEAKLNALDVGLRKCGEAHAQPIEYAVPPAASRGNPRWNSVSGQSESVLIKNATLFDGKKVLSGPVDILFEKGVITSVSSTESSNDASAHATVVDAAGKYVTPGLVDMHSHHAISLWPALSSTGDENEMFTEYGPLTPFVRAFDGIKAYDLATTLIASGGVTSSLILPGSANIMGGEAVPIKNFLRGGEHAEEVVEELLLEHGIPKSERRRYLKMACGENPKRVYGHTRMGDAWKLREQMAKGVNLVKEQDSWCLSAAAARDTGDMDAITSLVKGGFPEELALSSTVAMLRGQININVHCYEQEDFEDMLAHSEEFNFHVSAFHHALEAWKVPEMIKASGQNITIATFQDFGLYKKEAYDANLYAGKILAEHGVPLAYKSDHAGEFTNAKYLLFQAAGAHAFGVPEDIALQSVTSVPAASIQQDHRLGYVKPGYDADLVIWDSHPLSLGATPVQVYIDGKSTLDTKTVEDSLSKKGIQTSSAQPPKMRTMMSIKERSDLCQKVEKPGQKIVITGIAKSFIDTPGSASISSADKNMTMILEAGEITCFGSSGTCAHDSSADDTTVVDLKDGHVLPGLTALSASLGLNEISMEDSSGDGFVSDKVDPLNPSNVMYAKYGVHFDGRAFKRAQIGGITRSITVPMSAGFLRGAGVGIKTIGNNTIFNGGIFQDVTSIHFTLGEGAKGTNSITTISSAISKIRQILTDNTGKDNIYGKAANGTIPFVIHTYNKNDILQVISIQKDYPDANLVIVDGHEAWAVAEELADSKVGLIFSGARGAYTTWEKKDTLAGPPLTKSAVEILTEKGVKFGITGNSEMGDTFIHNLPLEASWAAKYAGLSDTAAIALVSRNIEEILGLEKSKDFVVYEGNPLEFGANVVMAMDGGAKRIGVCWPDSEML